MESKSLLRSFAAYLVHGFTASGAVLALFAFDALHQNLFIIALWYMTAAVAVDSVDGFLARRLGTKEHARGIDGALLDNVVDFVNYSILPAFFMLTSGILPADLSGWLSSGVVLASAFQFSQSDAKTEDHFFKGFPSYWNIVVFYLFLWGTSQGVNAALVALLIALTFVPIKYIYPSRPTNLAASPLIPVLAVAATIAWGAATVGMLWIYPSRSAILTGVAACYILLYFGFSLYRTLVPLRMGPAARNSS